MQRRAYLGCVLSAAIAGCSELTAQTEDSEPTAQEEGDSQQSYTTDDGIELAVDRVETTDEAVLVLDEETSLVPKGELQILVVGLSADNPTESAGQLPTPPQFSIEVDGETQDPYQVTFRDDPDGIASAIAEPVSGSLFPPTTELSSGSETTGWLIFSIPTESATATLRLRGPEGSVSNEWTVSDQE
ncbi:hypothetical protein [Halovenus sp. HT40]|uniref:hypothetical protein n=1 Tax=Halovenus sp. HT40 TaxID=3126691 RepID=UPI00300F4314